MTLNSLCSVVSSYSGCTALLHDAAADPAGADLVSLQQYTCSSSSSSGGRGSACTRPKGWCEVTGVLAVAPTHEQYTCCNGSSGHTSGLAVGFGPCFGIRSKLAWGICCRMLHAFMQDANIAFLAYCG